MKSHTIFGESFGKSQGKKYNQMDCSFTSICYIFNFFQYNNFIIRYNYYFQTIFALLSRYQINSPDGPFIFFIR